MDISITDSAGASASVKRSVCWSSVWAGTLAAIVATMTLVALGAGLGFASVNPWSGNNPSATTLSVLAVIWLIIVQWAASALGGYLTGRLRSRPMRTHHHLLMFRDTAHGFLVWALATILIALFSTSMAMKSAAIESMGRNGRAGQSMSAADPTAYYIDTLFRGSGAHARADQEVRDETRRVLAKSMTGKNGYVLSSNDRSYLAQLVTEYTPLSQTAAQERVDDVVAQAKNDANEARKTASVLSILVFLSMLIGAFVAAVAAALGGRHRDGYEYMEEGGLP